MFEKGLSTKCQRSIEDKMNRIRNEKGMILITVLLLMAIVALLGTMAINTSTVDVQIAGNLKRSATAFGGAEAGVDVSVPIIEETLAEGTLTPTTYNVVGSDNVTRTINLDPADDDSLGNEIGGASNYDGDISDFTVPDLGGVQVEVDIDRLYSYNLPGGAMEFASGYEGVGAAAAGGGIGILYRVTSRGTK